MKPYTAESIGNTLVMSHDITTIFNANRKAKDQEWQQTDTTGTKSRDITTLTTHCKPCMVILSHTHTFTIIQDQHKGKP